jgi:hypothetical protein
LGMRLPDGTTTVVMAMKVNGVPSSCAYFPLCQRE